MAIEVELPILPEKQTFTIWVDKEDLCQNSWADKECVQFTEEQTNIHVEWVEVPHSGWQEKVNLAFASGDLPDAFIGGVDIVSNMDALAPLDEIIDSGVAPNVLQMFDDLPDMRGALTLSDGHIYSLPIGDADVKNEINAEIWINTTWLDNLDLSMPTTLDEFYDVLVAFRDGDPNGNGEADEIPLLVSSTSGAAQIDPLFGFFGTLENDYHVRIEDGKVVFTPQEDGYFEALQWLHKLYAEGLMNQGILHGGLSAVPRQGKFRNLRRGRVPRMVHRQPDAGNLRAGLHLYAPVRGHGLEPQRHAPTPRRERLNGFVITKSCSNPEALVRWYDYINSDLDILNLWNYGLKGKSGTIWRTAAGRSLPTTCPKALLLRRFAARWAPARARRCTPTTASAARTSRSSPTASKQGRSQRSLQALPAGRDAGQRLRRHRGGIRAQYAAGRHRPLPRSV